MTGYLLDVNVLLALLVVQHDFHQRVSVWFKQSKDSTLFICAITELGFLRVVTNAASYGLTIEQGKAYLSRFKSSGPVSIAFLSDNRSATNLPAWVKGPKQITDGHLVDLAKTHGIYLATLDARIPGAFLIP